MDQRLLQKLLADAQKKKSEMDSKVQELQNTIFTSSVSKNLIEIEANGKYEVISCKLSEEAMDDKEILEDLIISAFNDVVDKINRKVKEIESQFMPKKFF